MLRTLLENGRLLYAVHPLRNIVERLHELGVATGELQLRELEIAYRKPCFAGERVEVMVQALRSGDRFGAVGSFVPLDREDRRPHCYVQVWF